MQLKLILPTRIEVDMAVKKVIAEADNGYFCLLPRHIDFVAGLSQGILLFVDRNDRDWFYAVDGGILVKCGDEVRISTTDAFQGPDLQSLQERVGEHFLALDEHDRLLRSALTRLELGTIRRLRNLKKQYPEHVQQQG